MSTKIIGIVLSTCMAVWTPAVFALSSNDNLGSRAKASHSEKSSLCEAMTGKIQDPKVSAPTLCSCISGANSNGKSDFLQIAKFAAACSVMLKNAK